MVADKKVTFTNTEAKIMAILEDGEAHSREELHKCLWDEYAAVTTVNVHLTHLRTKLRPIGKEIVRTTVNREYGYRLVSFHIPS